MEYGHYKSGTDIRFTAVDTEAGRADVTPGIVGRMAAAFGAWVLARTGKNAPVVAVGHDCRVSAEWIRAAAVDALARIGCTVLDCGLTSTPSVFLATQYPETNADAGLMITASHHPSDKNGLKFFTRDGGLEGSDIADILAFCENREAAEAAVRGAVRPFDLLGRYCEDLRATFRAALGEREPLAGLHLVVDAGNGCGGFFAKDVLAPLGADVGGSQFLTPDGTFPNHIPNPENPAAMKAISDCVRAANADLGIIFDTDVDRAAIVAADGREINRDRLIALVSAIVLQERPGATIVTDSVTSDGLAEFIAAHGGVHRRFKRGYKNVIDEAKRLTALGFDAPLAIETSGHAALRENRYLDDGAFLVVKLLVTMCRMRRAGKDLLDLIADLREPIEAREVRLGYTVADWMPVGADVLRALEEECHGIALWRVADDSCEGVRVSTPQGFFLVRMSVHDPCLPVNFEADVPGGVAVMMRALHALLKQDPRLDLSALEAAIS